MESSPGPGNFLQNSKSPVLVICGRLQELACQREKKIQCTFLLLHPHCLSLHLQREDSLHSGLKVWTSSKNWSVSLLGRNLEGTHHSSVAFVSHFTRCLDATWKHSQQRTDEAPACRTQQTGYKSQKVTKGYFSYKIMINSVIQ